MDHANTKNQWPDRPANLSQNQIDPDEVRRFLPEPFQPKITHGCTIGGVCMIRLAEMGASFWPASLSFASESAAHRFAVTWHSEDGSEQSGVFIPRRDTNSRFIAIAGGRLFPGAHALSRFEVDESGSKLSVSCSAPDCGRFSVEAERASSLSAGSVFSSLDEISSFFEDGSKGYSATRNPRRFDGLELHCKDWKVEPLRVTEITEPFFEEHGMPSAQFDSALLMERIHHEWRALPSLHVEEAKTPTRAKKITAQADL